MKAVQRRGSATTAAVFILAAVLIGAGVWYFVSDPFHTKVNANFQQMTKWTPENIAKDPVNYLNYCEEETNKAIESLKASRIAVAQNRANLQRMQDDAKNKISVGSASMAQLLAAYKSADSQNVWPVSWNGQSLNKDTVKVQVVSLNTEVKQQQSILNKVEAGLQSLDSQDQKITEAQANANQQLAEIQANRELLKVQSLTDDLKTKLVNMQSAVAATVGVANSSTSVVSLDQLTAQASAQPDNTEFDKILANSNSK